MHDADDQRLIFGESLHRLMHAYQRAMRRALSDSGITLSVGQTRVLKGAYFQAAPTVHVLAELMATDRAQVTRIVGQLRRLGLVESRPNPQDGRAPLIRCTVQGKAMIGPIIRLQHQAGLLMSEGLSQADIEQFVFMAETMAENLNGSSTDEPT
ncbi:MarR family winged helix-turn-helix transcriptional regulator [Salinisphaera sp. Q1T1-3]|uniref:MarR family winged helix-turn-helix transcriptional regulator n=1 Tax=Salinisphaera sp. Q1T1-3 TaxID=2321229 RepID=UPI001314F42B|nr:MarR family transcriptional regulator [Salinisphaera sp. Q1T1-3]